MFAGCAIAGGVAFSIIIMLTSFSHVSSPSRSVIDVGEYDEIARYVDGLFDRNKGAAPYIGASVAVLKDGETAVLSGYGETALEGGAPVDPYKTQFRLGSVSKWFTATAIAQLVDRGVVTIDAPANDYLTRFQLPAAYGADISVADLLTHRAGLESFDVHTFTTRAYDMPVGGDEIRSFMPRPISPPGEFSVYSNFGVSTLGAIIEDVTGMTFIDYVEENILDPLGMENTGLDHQNGVAAPPDLVKPAILRQDGSWETIPYYPKHPYFIPSGGVYSTAADMMKFMRAHLEAGRTETSRLIMSAQGYDAMHTALHANFDAPNIPKFGFVIWIDDYNGRKTLGHAGNVQTFRTFMLLVPEVDLGILVTGVGDVPYYDRKDAFWKVFNQEGVGGALLPIRAARNIASFYLGPRESRPVSAIHSDPDALRRYVGEYWNRQRPHSTFLQIFGYEGVATVKLADDGTLTIRGRKGFIPLAPGFLMLPDGSRTAAFIEENGEIVGYIDDYPLVWDRTEGLQAPETLQALHSVTAFALALFGAGALLSRQTVFAIGGVRLFAIAAGACGLMIFLWPLLVLDIQSQKILLELDATMLSWGVIGNLAWLFALCGIVACGFVAVFLRRNAGRPGAGGALWLLCFVVMFAILTYSTLSLGFFGLDAPGRF